MVTGGGNFEPLPAWVRHGAVFQPALISANDGRVSMSRELIREESGVSSSTGVVTCHTIHDDSVNAAMQQCGVPFIKEVSITCEGALIEGAALSIRFDGGLAHDLAMELPPESGANDPSTGSRYNMGRRAACVERGGGAGILRCLGEVR